MKQVKLRWPLILLFLDSITMVAQGSYIKVKAQVAAWMIGYSWQQRGTGAKPPKPWPWADTAAIARLQSPRLQKTQYVMQDASGESLAFGPGSMLSENLPGAAGHAVVAGHRDTHFSFVQKLRRGDMLWVDNYRGERQQYRVETMYVYDSGDQALTIDPDSIALTLVTCWPFDALVPGGSLRYVVHALAESGSVEKGLEYL